ncbi:hypothetical protein [Nostoc sp. FACHB-133]|uniref:hypothetical protein n=1 Tax=Nostoc sp. FACHB-133 TaxID=2692835 RepID=UPI001683EAFE|nr:hypothetical protein [Nostoc sp. FACHB-133]MBD2527336.1 hypothetical protein [Nostoc sp. FACHB-133]
MNFRSRYGFKTYIRRAIALRQIKYFSLCCGQFMVEKTVTLWCKSQFAGAVRLSVVGSQISVGSQIR